MGPLRTPHLETHAHPQTDSRPQHTQYSLIRVSGQLWTNTLAQIPAPIRPSHPLARHLGPLSIPSTHTATPHVSGLPHTYCPHASATLLRSHASGPWHLSATLLHAAPTLAPTRRIPARLHQGILTPR